MTTFGYRLNPRYAIKECLSCGALYTGDFCCSKGNVEDKILVPKLPKNYARYARCGHPINGQYCQRCTLLREKLEEDLVTYFQDFQNTFESSDDSTNVINAPREPFIFKQDHSVNPPHIDECAHIGYNCPPKIPIIFNPKPCNQTMNDELPQTLPSFDPTCYSDKENSVPCVSKPNFVDESSNIFNLPPQPPIYSCEFCGSNAQYEEQADSARYWKIPACCDDEDDYNSTITPVLSTEKPVDSLSMGDEHLDTILATKSDKVIKSSVENPVPIPSEFEEVAEIVIPEEEEIEDDNLREKLLNSSSTSPKSFLEETNTFHYSLPEFENFYFDLIEISRCSTTTHSDISLSDYEVFYFYDDHIEETSSGSTTTHSDISLSEYDSSIFDLLNDHFPPTDRSNFTHEEFVDELAHIISPPEYDCFYFRNLLDSGELISILNFGIRENLSSTIRVNLPVEDDHSPLLAYVV
nr:hypothetical protein [Tanacetum cinerariifolium]GEW82200.1 hypothetical protein [Tanacetum cinerariifolium]